MGSRESRVGAGRGGAGRGAEQGLCPPRFVSSWSQCSHPGLRDRSHQGWLCCLPPPSPQPCQQCRGALSWKLLLCVAAPHLGLPTGATHNPTGPTDSQCCAGEQPAPSPSPGRGAIHADRHVAGLSSASWHVSHALPCSPSREVTVPRAMLGLSHHCRRQHGVLAVPSVAPGRAGGRHPVRCSWQWAAPPRAGSRGSTSVLGAGQGGSGNAAHRHFVWLGWAEVRALDLNAKVCCSGAHKGPIVCK